MSDETAVVTAPTEETDSALDNRQLPKRLRDYLDDKMFPYHRLVTAQNFNYQLTRRDPKDHEANDDSERLANFETEVRNVLNQFGPEKFTVIRTACERDPNGRLTDIVHIRKTITSPSLTA